MDGQESILAQLNAHALLITGNDSMDLSAFVQTFLTQQCTDLSDQLDHPDQYWIRPTGTIKQIKIEDIRHGIVWSQTFPLLSEAKWIAIDEAEKLNEAASHALLKILEEPPSSVRFILISHHPQRLKPTIRSRVCRFHVKGKTAPKIIDPVWREQCFNYLLQPSSMTVDTFVTWGQSDLTILLEYWQKILHDLLLLQCDDSMGPAFLYAADKRDALKNFVSHVDKFHLWKFSECLNETIHSLQCNVALNVSLLLTRLMLAWQEM